MASDNNDINERTRLLASLEDYRLVPEGNGEHDVPHQTSQDEYALGETSVGERLPYNDYTTIDWLHDLVKDSYRYRTVHSRKGIRYALLSAIDSCEGWIAAAIIGAATACVAAFVDMAVVTVSDWKAGYCTTNIFASKEFCCTSKAPLSALGASTAICSDWKYWSTDYKRSFGIYVGFALLFGVISSSLTMLTKTNLPATAPEYSETYDLKRVQSPTPSTDLARKKEVKGKVMYMAAGSGIPEIKTILSGFVIPNFLDLKVLLVKAVGSIFAVPTGMNLGKEGPFVHISTCTAYIVAMWFPKYQNNGRKLREMLAVGCAAGLSVAFGAPIGGVLFTYEEISTYFPRKVLWRAFICSLVAAIVLRELNPTGTGRLVLFETNYGTTYTPEHYLVFIVLGIAGGIFGGAFCKFNFLWSKFFRKYSIIKNHPVFEVFLVVLVTALTQYVNPLTREPGDVVFKTLLVDCRHKSVKKFICLHEASEENGPVSSSYLGWLAYGTSIKLVLTIITFGIKVPSGVIIPALDAGAFFGRLIGQIPSLSSTVSPGIFALVGAGAFLAGVSRMTISLAVILFELTGELEFIVPNMIGIMVAKWVADALEQGAVYDLAQETLGHPFLDPEHARKLVQQKHHLIDEVIPPKRTMDEITVEIPESGCVSRQILIKKLQQLKARGLMDAGLVLVLSEQNNNLAGYLAQEELDFGLNTLGVEHSEDCPIRLLGWEFLGKNSSLSPAVDEALDLSQFVDRTPLTITRIAPMEYVVEMFSRLGLRYLVVTEQGTGRVTGLILKKRLVVWLERLKKH